MHAPEYFAHTALGVRLPAGVFSYCCGCSFPFSLAVWRRVDGSLRIVIL